MAFLLWKVSATTANTLLRHIAGLSVVAHQRSVHARELLIKMKQRQVGLRDGCVVLSINDYFYKHLCLL